MFEVVYKNDLLILNLFFIIFSYIFFSNFRESNITLR